MTFKLVFQIGTDIEDFKCSWLVVKALELGDEQQKTLLHVSGELQVASIKFGITKKNSNNLFSFTGKLWESR